MSSSAPMINTEDLKIDFEGILTNKEILKNHRFSNMQWIDNCHLNLLDLHKVRDEQLSSDLFPERKQQADDLNLAINKILSMMNNS